MCSNQGRKFHLVSIKKAETFQFPKKPKQNTGRNNKIPVIRQNKSEQCETDQNIVEYNKTINWVDTNLESPVNILFF